MGGLGVVGGDAGVDAWTLGRRTGRKTLSVG